MLWLLLYQALAAGSLCAIHEKAKPDNWVALALAFLCAELWPAFLLFLVFRRLL